MAQLRLENESARNYLRSIKHISCLLIQHQGDDYHPFLPKNASFLEHSGADIANPLAVNQGVVNRDGLFKAKSVFQNGQRLAVFKPDDIFSPNPAFFGKTSMANKMLVFPMHGNKNFRPRGIEHITQFFPVGMA